MYLPTHRAGREIRENPIRLKNRISEAESQLEQAGVDSSDIRRLCDPARTLCDTDSEENRKFWQHQSDGLAIFLSSEGCEKYRLPESFDELTVVAHRFHIKPLIKTVQQNEQYCVLAVSQGGVRFLEGSRSGLASREIEDLPESLQAVVRGDHQQGFNLHSFRVRANAGDTAVPHGHVESNEQHELDRYFRLIDEAIGDALRGDKRPLVFAGVEELFPYFQKASHYPHTVEQLIGGSPDDLSDDDLHELAWPIVKSLFEEKQQASLDRWLAAASTDLGETSLNNIVIAAHDGRIDTLLLEANRQRWGIYNAKSREVAFAESATAENYDLCDLAAVKTLRADGSVVILEDNQLADEGVASIYRYSTSS